jgi:major membrane immunogen (membrane-anchored lipoprotein)
MRASVGSQVREAGRDSIADLSHLNSDAWLLSLFRLSWLCLLAVSLSLLTGCALKASPDGIPPQAQAAIDVISNDINDGSYEKIYNEAAEEWRQAATPEQSGATFKTLKDKLGNVKGRSFHSATEQRNSSGTLPGHSFIITYKTTFERADGMETFTLVERNGRWLLARYFVNSDGLK